ncbi:hypothetical protein CS063_06255 [Sporanaerobium hydrogeniformans]|uniref:Uncharacterized protein n=1 Tax=Sporanaerobium hydrogeniformans TaxID=3072179 RepID=A0AC61DEF7_9FIRM|nr:transglutaminase domain-containing protein [Sporanaerobium hydrogeniformans]PHV71290.1 hypothetical protein CS063_06255 [Sporanaerobium hydrogeniformans]
MKKKKRVIGVLLTALILLKAPGTIKSLPIYAASIQNGVKALPTPAKIFINEKSIGFEAYSINDNNYIKLRDLAQAVKGSQAQFDIEWDSEARAINLVQGKEYITVGGELKVGDGLAKTATLSQAPLYKDRKKIELTAYTIDDTSYFRLRDLAEELDFYLGWDALTQGITIDTSLKNNGESKNSVGTQQDSKSLILDEMNLALPHKMPKKEPKTQEDYEEIILYMVANNQDSYEIKYDSDMRQSFQDRILSEVILKAHQKVFYNYPEYLCYKNMIEVSLKGTYGSGKLTLKLMNNNIEADKVNKMRDTFFEEVKVLAQNLIDEGVLTKEMTETQKAKVLYEWVILHLAYDTDYSEEGYTGYGALLNGKAVCQGYTGLYNALCKLVGIQITGIGGTAGENNESHMWSKAILDGKEVFIDTTFGDPVPDRQGVCDFKYFAVDKAFLSKTHTWE